AARGGAVASGGRADVDARRARVVVAGGGSECGRLCSRGAAAGGRRRARRASVTRFERLVVVFRVDRAGALGGVPVGGCGRVRGGAFARRVRAASRNGETPGLHRDARQERDTETAED